jgi:hypothetical protein
MYRTYSKRQAADALISRAIDLYLRVGDYIGALVLAGSAETMIGEMLRDGGTMNSRSELSAAAAALSGAPACEGAIRSASREVLDWLRHSGQPLAARPEIRFSPQSEAADAIEHALSNYRLVWGDYPPALVEWDEARRRRSDP